jgi:hypothetical protein
MQFKMLGIEALSMLEYSNNTDLGGSKSIDVYPLGLEALLLCEIK